MLVFAVLAIGVGARQKINLRSGCCFGGLRKDTVLIVEFQLSKVSTHGEWMENPILIIVDVINTCRDRELFGDLIFTTHINYEKCGVTRVSTAVGVGVV
jgi:hypothetical protein